MPTQFLGHSPWNDFPWSPSRSLASAAVAALFCGELPRFSERPVGDACRMISPSRACPQSPFREGVSAEPSRIGSSRRHGNYGFVGVLAGARGVIECA